MSHTLPRIDRFCFRVHSSGWFVVIDESLLNSAARTSDNSNAAYRRVKHILGFSHSDCFKFLVGYELYVQGYVSAPEAAFFCSFLS